MKKNILFILPRKPKSAVHFVDMPPIGLLTLATLTDKDSFRVSIIDENKKRIRFSENTDLVCISISTLLAERGYLIADAFRKHHIPIIFGGIHASALPEGALKHADSVVIGECEDIWNSILGDFLEGKLKKKYYQDAPTDLAKIPSLDFSLLSSHYFFRNLIQTTRGCPNNCTYCSVSKFYGKKIRHKPVDKVVQEIMDMKRNSTGFLKDWFFVTDDNIIADKKYSKELLKALAPLKIKIIAQATVFLGKDADLLKLCKQAGVRILYLGLESIDDAFLQQVHKSNQPAEYIASIKNIRMNNIAVIGSFILSDNQIGTNIIGKTLRFAKDHLDLAEFQALMPLPGSALYDQMKLTSKLIKFSWADIRNADHNSGRSLKNVLSYCYHEFYSLKEIFRRLGRIHKHFRTSLHSLAFYLLLNLSFHLSVGRNLR